jgi:thioredoxin-dependent peroxiredoxin
MTMLDPGQRFPDFSLQNQDGKTETLADYTGKWLVVYVYPKDDTPGCTIQGKAFTATKAEFEKRGIHVAGVSADDVASHKEFCNKYSLTVELLSDPSASLLKALGVPQSEYKGTLYWGRTTFVVDPKGVLRKVYPNVSPQGHEETLLKDIVALQG